MPPPLVECRLDNVTFIKINNWTATAAPNTPRPIFNELAFDVAFASVDKPVAAALVVEATVVDVIVLVVVVVADGTVDVVILESEVNVTVEVVDVSVVDEIGVVVDVQGNPQSCGQ